MEGEKSRRIDLQGEVNTLSVGKYEKAMNG